VSKLA